MLTYVILPYLNLVLLIVLDGNDLILLIDTES